MEECASGYAAYVLELLTEAKKVTTDPIVLIEQRLDYSKYVESGFGTGDCVLIADGTLNIVDYKHGNMPCKPPSAVRRGTDGRLSRDAPTASTPMKGS